MSHNIIIKKIIPAVLIISTVLILIATCSVIHVNREYNTDLFNSPSMTLDDNWYITDGIGAKESVTLPCKIEYGRSGSYTLSRRLPELSPSAGDELCLIVYSYYITIDVFCGGKMLYSSAAKEPPAIGKSTGCTFHIIPLDKGLSGQELELRIRFQFGEHFDCQMTAPTIESKSSFLHRTVMRAFPSLIVSMLLLALGVILAIFAFAFKNIYQKKEKRSLIFAALFSLLFALYTCCENYIVILLTPNSILLHFYDYTLFTLLPIVGICVFYDHISIRFQRIASVLLALFSLNHVIQIILHITRLSDFRQMMLISQASAYIATIAICLMIFITKESECPGVRHMKLSSIPLACSVLAALALYGISARTFTELTLPVQVGIGVFLIMQLRHFIVRYAEVYRVNAQSETYRQMAYVDSLTGLSNRNAYEKYIDSFDYVKDMSVCCIVADVNNLKYSNDTYGHSTGDRLIISGGQFINSAVGCFGRIFRTGGDEYVAILNDCTTDEINECIIRLKNSISEYNINNIPPLSLAVGIAWSDINDADLLSIIRRADENMYADKLEHKNSCK